MSYGKQVEYSPFWAALYTPYSDSLIASFAPGSLPGRILSNKIKNGFSAGLAGMGISYIANKTYHLIANQKPFSSWLNYHPGQAKGLDAAQLATRAVVHFAIGSGFGLFMSFLSPSSGMTAATGIALGGAAFVGPQLARLAYKITAFVLSQMGAIILSSFKHLAKNPGIQAWAAERKIKEMEKTNSIESQIYQGMNLDLTSNFAKLKNMLYKDKPQDYDDQIKHHVKSDLLILQRNPTFYHLNAIDISEDNFCTTLSSLVEEMGAKILEQMKKNKVDSVLINKLSGQVVCALAENNPQLLAKCLYIPNMNDPFRFTNPIKITKSDVDLINQIYDLARIHVFQNSSTTTQTQNKIVDLDIVKNELFPLLEKDLRSNFILNAVCYAAWINSPQNTPNDVLVPFVQKAIQQAFNEDKLSSIQEIDISLTPDIIHEDKVVQLKQVDLEYINEKFAYTRKLLAAFPTQLDACKRIYLEIYKNFNLNPYDYNPHLLPWLCLSIVEAAVSLDKNTLNDLDKNSSPTLQLQNTTHSLTNKDIDFINNIFRFAKKELNLI